MVKSLPFAEGAGAPWRRIGLALVGALLTGDAIALMLMGLFNFGVALPLAIGPAFLALARNGVWPAGGTNGSGGQAGWPLPRGW
ncbi:hypothetical protein [Cupriavidus sp. amp6]|uniref:hypothetical protein n=1 Tax=Cupriavidus sp. amp6 TaxID=388051 RepID=UPI000424073A|nr:hypothetical protein [Cupriavidus sp. amp6]